MSNGPSVNIFDIFDSPPALVLKIKMYSFQILLWLKLNYESGSARNAVEKLILYLFLLRI